MFSCSVCSTNGLEIIDGIEYCSTCKFPFRCVSNTQVDMGQKAWDWAKKVWSNAKDYQSLYAYLQPQLNCSQLEETSLSLQELLNRKELNFKSATEQCDRLKIENERLKAENGELKINIETLKAKAQLISIPSPEKSYSLQDYVSFSSTNPPLVQVPSIDAKDAFVLDILSALSSRVKTLEEQLSEIPVPKSHVKDLAKRVSEKDSYDKSMPQPANEDAAQNLTFFNDSISEVNQEISAHPIALEYNRDPHAFSHRKIAIVTELEESQGNRRVSKTQMPVLHEDAQGNYWVIQFKTFFYLVPAYKIRLNQYNFEIFQALYRCHGSRDYTQRFQLWSPAIISLLPGEHNIWQVDTQGVVEFASSTEVQNYFEEPNGIVHQTS